VDAYFAITGGRLAMTDKYEHVREYAKDWLAELGT
jgi:hypothetical protein